MVFALTTSSNKKLKKKQPPLKSKVSHKINRLGQIKVLLKKSA